MPQASPHLDMDHPCTASLSSSKLASTLEAAKEDDKPAAYSTSLPELPVPMMNAQGAILNGCVYLGGGYTGNSKTDPVVFVYDVALCKWTILPAPCPAKWSGLAVHGEKVVSVGGKPTQCSITDLVSYTNKVAVWNEQGDGGGGRWEHSLPTMSTGRLCPIVISHEGCLIAAGGNKGQLDYRAEVLQADAERWMCGPPLPLPCFAHTSTTVGGKWYLLDLRNGKIHYASLSKYVAMAAENYSRSTTASSSGDYEDTSPNSSLADLLSFSPPPPTSHGAAAITTPESSQLLSLSPTDVVSQSLWKRLPIRPPQTPFKIASTRSQLLALSNSQDVSSGNITLHVYQDNLWVKVEGRFPSTLGSGLLLSGQRDQDTLYVFGGQVNHRYTTSAHKLAFMTLQNLKLIKKSRQLKVASE